ncbi:hypothetical protein EDD11_004372 [Mortierella claussenii]|nr:hypothetical protein EDD11_004372 [Mortierella claussenii]
MSSSTGSAASSGRPTEFMSEYMSGLSQSQDLNSFLQKNQPTYDPNNSSTDSNTIVDKPAKEPGQDSSSSSTPSGSESSSSSTQKPFDFKMPVGSHPLPSAHAVYQKKAIHSAALDNCADLNVELTDCLMGKSGSWWDRASMCMKAKELFQQCCHLNKEILQEQGYANEGNTPEQDRAIMDYADDHTQKAMKEGKKA